MITQFNNGYESVAEPKKRSTEYIVWRQAQSTLNEAYDGLSLLEDKRPGMEEGEYVRERGYWLGRIEACKLELERAWAALEATYQHCTCKPDGNACAFCVAQNRQRYGDSIPVPGVVE